MPTTLYDLAQEISRALDALLSFSAIGFKQAAMLDQKLIIHCLCL